VAGCRGILSSSRSPMFMPVRINAADC
jgi:hypothetical protein